MKTILLSIILAISAIAVHATVVTPPKLPPGISSNDWAYLALANSARAAELRNVYAEAKLDTLQHRMDRLELGFVLVIAGMAVTLTAISLLTARDAIRARRRLTPPDS